MNRARLGRTRLGRTGLAVSRVGLGGIPIMRLDFQAGVEVVRYCFEEGITFFDTANKYGDSELKIGQALAGVREKVVLASKSQAREAGEMAEHIDLSLERLKTTKLDLYQLHMLVSKEDLEKVIAPGGAYQALARAREEGKIDFIGFSSHNLDTAIAGCRTGLFDTVQVAFNFIEQEPAEELLRVAGELDLGIIGMKPLGGGLLRQARLCLSFLQGYPQVVPIPGAQSIKEAAEIIDLFRHPRELSRADWEEIGQIRAELGDRFCHRCEYCLPCDQGVPIPKVLHFRSIAARYSAEQALNWAGDLMDCLEDCLDCRACVERCPYDLPIPELMRECAEIHRRLSREVRDRPE